MSCIVLGHGGKDLYTYHRLPCRYHFEKLHCVRHGYLLASPSQATKRCLYVGVAAFRHSQHTTAEHNGASRTEMMCQTDGHHIQCCLTATRPLPIRNWQYILLLYRCERPVTPCDLEQRSRLDSSLFKAMCSVANAVLPVCEIQAKKSLFWSSEISICLLLMPAGRTLPSAS